MAAAWNLKAVASVAVIAAATFLGGTQGLCTSAGVGCTPRQVYIESGCAHPEAEGFCSAVSDTDIVCSVKDAGTNGQDCGSLCKCFEGVCFSVASTSSTPIGLCDLTPLTLPGTGGDPHMIGLQGQKIDWNGQDGGWYALLSQRDIDAQISLRLTAPLPTEFEERQLITGFALKGADGHSLIIKTKNPYTTQTAGCPEQVHTPCLSEDALEIIVDGEDLEAVAVKKVLLPGGTVMTAFNLPTECQPYGGDVIWANTFAEMERERQLANTQDITEWVLGWSTTTAAPSWCEKFIEDSGTDGLLDHRGKHAAFRIETPFFAVRLHHGTNHQGGETLEDGRILPDLEFWQMDVHFEWTDFDANSVTGILGETVRPVLDSAGRPIMSGVEALRGKVEDYRVSGPLDSNFPGFNE